MTITFAFSPAEKEKIQKCLDDIGKSAKDDVYFFESAQFEELLQSMDLVCRSFGIKSRSVALAKMCNVTMRHLEELGEPPPKGEWAIEKVFETTQTSEKRGKGIKEKLISLRDSKEGWKGKSLDEVLYLHLTDKKS